MASTDWIDERLDRRQRDARARMAARKLSKIRKQRVWARDIARVMLVASILVLGVLAVEISRKAVVVLNHADAGPISSATTVLD
ncbi:hypothetical protein [Azospirillum soli]|uniref:hypothetical protein n=1 Tax=Azospirillum soli TaxID=1304799 RepID=UPI001AEB4E1B|nr:hypothetical protein [Azospirillum soli]MBP2311309.1 hypothetical protein [Azospirillum soli]